MIWQSVPLSTILILAAAVELVIAWVAWKRRSINGVLAFALLNVAGAIWCFCTAFEIAFPNIPSINFWIKLEFIGVVNIAPLWLLFTLGYTGRERWLQRRHFWLLWVIPVICLGMVFTNDWHGLVWNHFHPITSSIIPVITFDFGPFLWAIAIYSYTLLLAGALAFIGALIRYPRVYRRQAIAMLVGVVIPWIGSLSWITGLTPGLDLSPLAISISGVIFTWNIIRYGFLDIVPVARDILIENMVDGVLVLDAQSRIVDINPTAQKLLRVDSQPVIGQNLAEAFKNWHNLDQFQAIIGSGDVEISSTTHPARFLDTHLSALYDQRGRAAGKLIILRDITAQKQIAQDEREQRAMAEALKDTIAALNSTLDFDEVLDLILEYVGRVVPHDAASIALVDEQAMVRIKRARGYKERNLEDFILSFKIPVEHFSNWRQMFATGQPILAADTHSYPDWMGLPETAWINSYAGVPICIKGKVIGVLNLDSATPGFFTHDHIERLQIFANQAASAIEKAQLFSEATSRAELMSSINRIGLAITSGLDLGQVFKTLYEQVQQVAPADVFYISLFDAESGEITFPLWLEGGQYYQMPARSIHENASLTGHIIQTQKTLYFSDTLEPNFEPPAPLVCAGGKLSRSYIGVPMVLGQLVLGTISMQNYLPNVYTTDQVHLLETVAAQVSITIENARLFAKMEQMATIDPVTELFNRRQFILLASREVERSLRYENDLAAMMVDIDHFKRVNDTYGHAVGDQVLFGLASLCKQSLRTMDIIGRYGGDEIALILPETTLKSAYQVAERLRQQIEEYETKTPQRIIKVTASFGVASFEGTQKDLESLLARTDQALYAAKQNGRNIVKSYSPPDQQIPGLFPPDV